jgi:hypothetical protein
MIKRDSKRTILKWIILPIIIILISSTGYYLYKTFGESSARTRRVISWIRNPGNHSEWMIRGLTRCEPTTPFLFPTDGYVGFLWDDSFRPGHHHQGIDIFTNKKSGITPVYSAHEGYLYRLPDWKSSLIIRIPADPLNPDRQIWTYYTHLADTNGNSYIVSDFPPGTLDQYVPEGTLLGYQGNFSGTPGHPVGVRRAGTDGPVLPGGRSDLRGPVAPCQVGPEKGARPRR